MSNLNLLRIKVGNVPRGIFGSKGDIEVYVEVRRRDRRSSAVIISLLYKRVNATITAEQQTSLGEGIFFTVADIRRVRELNSSAWPQVLISWHRENSLYFISYSISGLHDRYMNNTVDSRTGHRKYSLVLELRTRCKMIPNLSSEADCE